MNDRSHNPPPAVALPGSAPTRAPADELAQIIGAYNAVTDRLQQSHEMLTSEVRRLSVELASANTALERSRRLAALGEMAAGIAHEIRNPLAAIQLYAEMLESDLSDMPEQYDVIQRITSAVRGLNGIVTDVLQFARELRLRPVVAPAREVLTCAVDAMLPVIAEADVEVEFEIDDESIEVHHDRDMLHRALVNLIRNAAEAMDKGGTLTLTATGDAQSCQLTVRDTGPGISHDAIDRIFNPFFTTRPTGTGLGLAIVHRVVDAHGGSIAVHNDHGAVFTLTLPHAALDSERPDVVTEPADVACVDEIREPQFAMAASGRGADEHGG